MNTAPLLDLLARYTPADDHERRFLPALRALAAQGEAACDRHHFTPGHFTASAFVRASDGRSVALIFHPKFARWLQPGGHIEPTDPDIFAAARREVEEELGLTHLSPLGGGLFDVDIHDIPARKGEPAHQHFDLRFCFEAPAGAPLTGELTARWVPMEEVHTLESDASVLRGLAKLRAIP